MNLFFFFQSISVNFSLLLNIAESIKVEDKIRKRNIVSMLVECLERNSIPLLTVVTKFLIKLSVRAENKDEMVIILLLFKYVLYSLSVPFPVCNLLKLSVI